MDDSVSSSAHAGRSPSPGAEPPHVGDAVNPTPEERRRMKRDRDAAYGPTTPKGEGEEAKVLGLTPLAKKGRVQPDALGKTKPTTEPTSDSDSVPADDELEDHTPPNRLATPPAGLESTSAPPTPLLLNQHALPPRRESKETMSIRQRVEALEWDDGKGPAPAAPATGEDSEIADAAAEVSASAEIAHGEDQKDVELADAAAEVGESAAAVDNAEQVDVEIADVADEVAETAAILGEEQDKQMDVAEVAAEVADTAQQLAVEEEEAMVAEDIGKSAQVSTEVARSAEQIAKADEKDVEIAEVAADVPESAKGVEDPKPQVESEAPAAAPPAVPTYSSPFSAYSSTASLFAAVAPPTPSLPPADQQKPKFKSTFSAPLPPSTSAPASVTPAPSALPAALSTTPTVDAPAAEDVQAPPPTPSTPSAKPAATALSSMASPFSAFASTSGFAATPAPKPAPSTMATPFSAFASTSGLAASPSTTVASGSGFGSYSVASASPFSSVKTSTEVGGLSRKLGEPVEVDAGKRVFTEQEVVTGEEDDETLHSARCKLYAMVKGAWVERGTGVIKLSVTRDGGRSGARLVMRADATHRLLLNATLFSKFSVEITSEKYVQFAIIEGTEPISYMLRMAGGPPALTLTQAVRDRVALL